MPSRLSPDTFGLTFLGKGGREVAAVETTPEFDLMTGDLDMNNTLKPETANTPHQLTPEEHSKLQQVIDTYPSCLEPLALVQKGPKNRLCLDARKVNSRMIKDAYPLPHIEGLLSRLQETYYISAIDLKDAFWQIPLETKSREKTAFTVPGLPFISVYSHAVRLVQCRAAYVPTNG